jgi:hypothetical protein
MFEEAIEDKKKIGELLWMRRLHQLRIMTHED